MEETSENHQQENASESATTDLQSTIQELQAEKTRIQDEFNSQRAKLKELFLQKEAELSKKASENAALSSELLQTKRELDDIKSQVVVDNLTLESNFQVEKRKADEEIATLQQLVHETVEESSSTRSLYDHELRQLQMYIQKLKQEVFELKHEKLNSPHHTTQEHSLAPSVVLNALTKGIAKKLGAESFTTQENFEDSLKKPHEDVEVLRSLVEPLEDQIQALKEKLRSTDEQLQKCRECGHFSDQPETLKCDEDNSSKSTNTSFDLHKTTIACDMCSNYEAQLVREQKRTSELQADLLKAEKASDRYKEDLLKEIGFRKEMEEKWNEKKEEHKQQVAELTRTTECTEQDLKELRQFFEQISNEMHESLTRLTYERERIYHELDKLQKENDHLVDKYSIHSQDLQSQVIDLPSTVEELHELILKNHQDLILAKMGKESAEEKCQNMHLDLLQLKERMSSERHEKETLEDSLAQEINTLKTQKHGLEKEKKLFMVNYDKLVSSEKANQIQINDLTKQVTGLTGTIKHLEGLNSELKTRVISLQKEFDTTETVQKDFVRLSQSLQVQLEKIREADTQVRWQHEDDVESCPQCRTGLSNSRSKQHCRHCGQVFCQSCLTHTVNSGPNMRPSKVCDVCHTLLVKSSAPYFSEAPPMN